MDLVGCEGDPVGEPSRQQKVDKINGRNSTQLH